MEFNGNLDYFYVLSIIKNAAMNIKLFQFKLNVCLYIIFVVAL